MSFREFSVKSDRRTKPEVRLAFSRQSNSVCTYTPSDPCIPKIPTPSHARTIEGTVYINNLNHITVCIFVIYASIRKKL